MTVVVHRVEVSARALHELRPDMDRLLDAGWTHVDCVKPQLKTLNPTACVVVAFVKGIR